MKIKKVELKLVKDLEITVKILSKNINIKKDNNSLLIIFKINKILNLTIF